MRSPNLPTDPRSCLIAPRDLTEAAPSGCPSLTERMDTMTGSTIVRVLLTIGDVAELATPNHPANAPLKVPAERIATQANLPIGELPGRRFTVTTLTQEDADGFQLLNDPRL